MNVLGSIGGVLFIIKVLVHIYIKYSLNKNYEAGPAGFLNFELLFPILDDVKVNLTALKLLGNTLFILSIICIIIFLFFR